MTSDHNKDCDCYDCRQNNIDFPSWTDVKNKATEVLGYATGNPATVASAKQAQETNKVLKEMAKKGIIKTPDKGFTVETEDIAPGYNEDGSRQVEVEPQMPEIFKKLKWVLIIAIAVVLIAVFLRIRGK